MSGKARCCQTTETCKSAPVVLQLGEVNEQQHSPRAPQQPAGGPVEVRVDHVWLPVGPITNQRAKNWRVILAAVSRSV